MTTSEVPPIPYRSQAEPRTCGAAALAMVYAALASARRARGGEAPVDASPDEIWPRIAKPDRVGGFNGATHLMVRDALSRGYAAVALQASDPLRLLLSCRVQGVHAILNHRLRPESLAGHFTVLVGMDEEAVLVHDPSVGPSQRLPFGRLLELWQPRAAGSEIVGHMAIVIADTPSRLERCTVCSLPIPGQVPCPQCGGGVPLAPSAVVGCVAASCVNRAWLRVCCPECDYTFPYVGAAEEEPSVAGEGRSDLGLAFAQLERFQAFFRSRPELADREDVKEQLGLIDRKKVELRLAEHEEIARRNADEALASERRQAYENETEEIRKAQEAAASTATPLDGSALAADLLKSLGFVK